MFRRASGRRFASEAIHFRDGNIIVKFRYNGIDWSIYDEGNGKALVFLHGFPFDRRLYQGACQSLTDRYRVLIPDLPGFGKSQFQSGTEGPSCLEMSDFADGLAVLLDELDESNAVICGLSMGGYIAMQFFRRHSDQLAGLIFCDTRSTPDIPSVAEKRRVLADSVHNTGAAPLADQMIPALLSPKTIAENPDVVSSLTEMISEQLPSGIAAAARGMAARDDSTQFLKDITVPTLVMVGEDDHISPPEAMREMANIISKSEFCTVPGAGHLPPLENPLFFTEAVRQFAGRVYGEE